MKVDPHHAGQRAEDDDRQQVAGLALAPADDGESQRVNRKQDQQEPVERMPAESLDDRRAERDGKQCDPRRERGGVQFLDQTEQMASSRSGVPCKAVRCM